MTPERASRRIASPVCWSARDWPPRKSSSGCSANSTAVVSDGLESAGDVLASGLVLLG